MEEEQMVEKIKLVKCPNPIAEMQPLRLHDVTSDLSVHTVLVFNQENDITLSLTTAIGTVNVLLSEKMARQLSSALDSTVRPEQVDRAGMLRFVVEHRALLAPRDQRRAITLAERGPADLSSSQIAWLHDAYSYLRTCPIVKEDTVDRALPRNTGTSRLKREPL